MASFKNPVQNNFIDETILSTPLPEATSTVNNNRSPSNVAVSVKPIVTSLLASRLTGAIEELKSFHEALNTARKISHGQNNSILSVTDLAFDEKLASKASLGLLDIDALLANETINDTQEIMDSLYKIQCKTNCTITKSIDKGPTHAEEQDSSLKSHNCDGASMNSQAVSGVPRDGSVVGVPSFFLTADDSVSEVESFSEAPSFGHTNAISEASAEVAAIMAKDTSFDSERISFDQGEVSGRSTSLGGSNSSSNSGGNFKSQKNVSGAVFEDEDFIADEGELLKKLEMDEKSFSEKQLPPIIPELIPDPNSSAISTFSGAHEEEKIIVRPSWIGLGGENDDPINISIGQYFRMKSDVIPRLSGHQSSDKRPSFGMKITSPERKGVRPALVSESFNLSSAEASNNTPKRNLNLTQVVTPKCHPQSRSTKKSEETNVTNADLTNLSLISTPSLSCIDNILREIDLNDSHGTMADKFLRYSSSSSGSKRPNYEEDPLPNKYSSKDKMNTFINSNVESKAIEGKQKTNAWTPRPPQIITTKEKTKSKLAHSCQHSSKTKEGESVMYKVPDLVKKLNSIERSSQNDKGALKTLSNFVNMLESNVAGPLDCSALYESLSNDDLVVAGPLDRSKLNSGQTEDEPVSFATECNGGKSWVEVPEELLLLSDGDVVQQRHCVGIGFKAYVPIRNLTNEWLMYQVSPVKSDGQLTVDQLPIQTLLAPGSQVEFEAIVVPMAVGKHFAEIEIKVINFMVQENSSSQCYLTRLVLNANFPKVKVMTENLRELEDKEFLNFGILPEECSKIISVHILNVGLSNIPIRLVIDEVPEAFRVFQISGASRTPFSNLNASNCQSVGAPSRNGIHLEREDLLSCDLSGSGPHAMIAVAIMCHSPRFDQVTHKMPSKLGELCARMRVELDVPSNFPSKLTILKEVSLTGLVGKTELKVGIENEPLTLFSEEIISQTQHSNGRGAVPKTISGTYKKYNLVSKSVPVFNLGVVKLDLTLSVLMTSGKKIEGDDDDIAVVPDSLTLKPGERSSVRVMYRPVLEDTQECNRILSIAINPNGPVHTFGLKGVPGNRKVWDEENVENISPTETEATNFSYPTDSNHLAIQTTHPRVVWGSVPINSHYAESIITLKNPSQALEKVLISINGSKDYKLVNHELDIVGKTSLELLPRQSKKIKIFFRPKKLGPSVGKLMISVFDGSHPERKITDKMMMLSGYGGHSKVEVISLPKDLSGRLWCNLGLIPSNPPSAAPCTFDSGLPRNNKSSRSPSPTLSATSVKNRLQIHNSGSLPAFVKLVPLAIGIDPETLFDLEEGREHSITVRPDFCELEPSTSVTIWVTYVHRLSNNVAGSENNRESSKRKNERAQEEVANLLIVSGDVPTRSRLQKIYKTAEVTQSNKDTCKFLGLGGKFLSFIGVTSCPGTKPELEDLSDSSDKDEAIKSLCDPINKETVNSLIQTLTTIEVQLVVEKDDQTNESENEGHSTLTLSCDEEMFHSLLDVTIQPPVPSLFGACEAPAAPNSRPSSKVWSIEPEGTVYLGSARGLSASLLLLSHTNDDIFFEARVGFREMDGRLKWLPPPHRQAVQTSQCTPVVVEPWQGRLLPNSRIKMKLTLQKMSEYPSQSGILQVYSENDHLRVNIKIEGCGSQFAPRERRWKNVEGNKNLLMKSFERKNRIISGVQDKGYEVPSRQSSQAATTLTRKYDGSDNGLVSADTTTLEFPTTKVGSSAILKITLRNPSNETHEVIVNPVSRPYVVPKGSRELKAYYYLSIKVAFCPESPGHFEQTFAIKTVSRESSKENLLAISLKGKSTF